MLKFKKVDNASGTSLRGYVNISYHTLVKIFGEPNYDGDGGYKVQKEWVLDFDTGSDSAVRATIYDWKQSESYNGPGQGTHYTQVNKWHIGGYDDKAVDCVNNAILECLELEEISR